jgi:hypothetical protein
MIEYPQIFLYENIPSFKVRGTKHILKMGNKVVLTIIQTTGHLMPFLEVFVYVNVIKNIVTKKSFDHSLNLLITP